jgi:hypothetical protein
MTILPTAPRRLTAFLPPALGKDLGRAWRVEATDDVKSPNRAQREE